jgi:hypothetical protein
MEKLSNEEFVDRIQNLKDGRRLPPELHPEDRANLELANKFITYRKISFMEMFGSNGVQKDLMVITKAMDRLRPVEKQIIYFYLVSGFPIEVVSNLTYRTLHHGVNALRSGLSSICKTIATYPSPA